MEMVYPMSDIIFALYRMAWTNCFYLVRGENAGKGGSESDRKSGFYGSAGTRGARFYIG